MQQLLVTGLVVACYIASISCQTGMSAGAKAAPAGIENYLTLLGGRSAGVPAAAMAGRMPSGSMAMLPAGLSMPRQRSRPAGGMMGGMGGNMAIIMSATGAEFQDMMAYNMCSRSGMPAFMCMRYLM